MTVVVIVARHAEDLAWLDTLAPAYRIVIADQGEDGGAGIVARPREGLARVELPNVGKDQHAHLSAIAALHPLLRPGDVVVCCQGRIDDHADGYGLAHMAPKDMVERMAQEAAASGSSANSIVWRGPMAPAPFFKVSGAYPHEKDSGMTFGLFYSKHVRPGEPYPDGPFRWYKNAVFAVRAEHVLSLPRERYEALAAMLDEPHCEATHYIERAWYYLLGLDRPQTSAVT